MEMHYSDQRDDHIVKLTQVKNPILAIIAAIFAVIAIIATPTPSDSQETNHMHVFSETNPLKDSIN